MLWVVFGFVAFLGTPGEIVFNSGKFGNEKKRERDGQQLTYKILDKNITKNCF